MLLFSLIRSIFFVAVEVKGYKYKMKTLYVMSLLKLSFFKFCFPSRPRLEKHEDSWVNATNRLAQDLTSRVYFLLQQHVKVKNKRLILQHYSF